MDTNWFCKRFSELTTKEFHDVIQLREEVFVVEQDCPYLDVDGKDIDALHVFGTSGEQVIATARILPQGISYDEVSIGRVVVSPNARGKGIGVELMKEVMYQIEKRFGAIPVRISAQTYLLKYYAEFGFQQEGEPYLEDNIPHIQMLYSAK